MRIAIVGTIVLALLGCSDVGSDAVLTDGMYATLSVRATGDGSSRTAVVLRVGGAGSTTFVELEGDDQLTSTVEQDTQLMTPETLGTYHQYVATHSADESDVDYIIDFSRSIDDGAPESVLQLPPPFEVDALTINEFSRESDDLTVTWTPTDSGTEDEMVVSVDGECVLYWSVDVDGDPGTYTIESGSIEGVSDDAQNCSVTVQVERRRPGIVDSGYGEGGTAFGYQTREVELLSTP